MSKKRRSRNSGIGSGIFNQLSNFLGISRAANFFKPFAAVGIVVTLIYLFLPSVWAQFFESGSTSVNEQPHPSTRPQPNPQEVEPTPPTTTEETAKALSWLPIGSMKTEMIKHSGFTLAYHEADEQALWVAYQLNSNELMQNQVERTSDFRPDPLVKTKSAEARDYKSTGYDRGHLCPASDRAVSLDKMSETFYMSNISPQIPGFNRGIWKQLEENVRDWTSNVHRLYVVTGPILENPELSKKIGYANKITVPREFYKVIVDLQGGKQKGIGFIIHNQDSDRPLNEYVVSIDQIEKRTNLNFFPKLSKNQELNIEAKVDLTKWGNNKRREALRIKEAKIRFTNKSMLIPE
jgi:endonuclease G